MNEAEMLYIMIISSKMKRTTITIDEFITMPIQKLNRLIDEAPNGNIKIDMNGLSIRDMVEKYNLLTIDEVISNINRKLNKPR